MSKFSKTLFSLAFIVILSLNIMYSQNVTSKIALTPMVSDVLELPTTAKNALQQKLAQMALQNGMANQEGDFILTANYSIIEREATPTAPPQIAVKLEVMTYVVNLLEDIVVAEKTFTVRGVDLNENKALLRAINQINVRSQVAQDFINTARTNIINYYENKAQTLMIKAKSLGAAGQFSDALSVLEPIPECVPSFSDVQNLKDQLFSNWVDNEATNLLSEAKKAMALGDYESSFNFILGVNPLSSKFVEAEALASEIDSRIIAAKKAAAIAKEKEQETAVAIAQAQAATRIKEEEAEIAKANAREEEAKAARARANAYEAQANADAAIAQAAISQSQLQTLEMFKDKMDKLSSDAQKAIVDNAFKVQVQGNYIATAVATVKPQQSAQEKENSLKKFILGKK